MGLREISWAIQVIEDHPVCNDKSSSRLVSTLRPRQSKSRLLLLLLAFFQLLLLLDDLIIAPFSLSARISRLHLLLLWFLWLLFFFLLGNQGTFEWRHLPPGALHSLEVAAGGLTAQLYHALRILRLLFLLLVLVFL